jgi:hypothetical protein
VHLVVADSRTVEPPGEPRELLFIDGDHSYAGALLVWRPPGLRAAWTYARTLQ